MAKWSKSTIWAAIDGMIAGDVVRFGRVLLTCYGPDLFKANGVARHKMAAVQQALEDQ